jgi:sugar lactone lactonase YvrE
MVGASLRIGRTRSFAWRNAALFASFVLFGLSALSFGQTVPQYTISTFAGNGTGTYAGDGGAATSASLNGPSGLAVDSSGNVYIADTVSNCIRKVTSGTISTVAGTCTVAATTGNSPNPGGYSGDGKAATSAQLSHPDGVTVDSTGNLYIADTNNFSIRKVTGGTISTYAGTHVNGYTGDGAAATSAELIAPVAVQVDKAGNLYISDAGASVIRQVTIADGNINTWAGTGNIDFWADNIAAVDASLNAQIGVSLDAAGNLFIADQGHNLIRKVTLSSLIMTTVAGSIYPTSSDNGGYALNISMNDPTDVAVDSAGNLYIVDSTNCRIIYVSASTGVATAIAGAGLALNPATNMALSSGDGGLATEAYLAFPKRIALGPNGAIYISESQSNKVRMLTPVTATVPTSIPPTDRRGSDRGSGREIGTRPGERTRQPGL